MPGLKIEKLAFGVVNTEFKIGSYKYIGKWPSAYKQVLGNLENSVASSY